MQTVEIAVAGVSIGERQRTLKHLANRTAGARLVREPHNSYDPNAIAVYMWDESEGPDPMFYMVGYVPRILAAQLAPRMDAGEQFPVTAVRIVGGDQNGKTTYGARLDLANVIREGVTK